MVLNLYRISSITSDYWHQPTVVRSSKISLENFLTYVSTEGRITVIVQRESWRSDNPLYSAQRDSALVNHGPGFNHGILC